MNIELVRFRVKPGQRQQVDQWMDFLNSNLPAVLETLEGEKMYVETIFSETINDQDYLYWYSIQGEGGIEVQDSTHWIDEAHIKFWQQCIDPDYAPQSMQMRVSMIPQNLREKML